MSIVDLARPEIVAMKPYSSARKEASDRGVLLNANESPWSLLPAGGEESTWADSALNRYPEPQPARLAARLAALYGVSGEHLLITRGSDEGIDLLTRVFCRAGKDAVLQCPPTFGMYRIAAQAQGAEIISIPRLPQEDFRMDESRVLNAVDEHDRVHLVFLTSPNNPTGDTADTGFLLRLLEAAEERAVVVVDEAYAEFCDQPSVAAWVASHQNLVVLRTLSKAWAAAGLRCGVVIAQRDVIELLQRIIAPYPLASPVVALAERMLEPDILQRQQTLLSELKKNKQALLDILNGREFITRIWPGEANFVLIRVSDADALLAHCGRCGVVLRAFATDPMLENCIRISVGNERDLGALEAALDSWPPPA
jgi:histidinol-phosphate aminotransferase